MKELIAALLLVVVVAVMYTNTSMGESGTHEQLAKSGTRMGDMIERINP